MQQTGQRVAGWRKDGDRRTDRDRGARSWLGALGVESFPPPPPLVSELASLGYEHLGEAGVQGRLYFRRRGRRSFNLHLVELGSDHWRNALALRDYLIAHPAERSRYVEAKRRAVADGRTTLLAYSEAKTAVLSDLIVRARVWAGSR
jgi:GrpB-like predicted nucleotidyltransferase (UPF0157 family)